MADEYSFDIVSHVDLQAIDDAINTANKEINVRFDFRGSQSRLEFDKPKGEVTLYSDDEGKLQSVVQIFQSRCAKRGVDLKAMDYLKVETALGGKVKQQVNVKQGISSDIAKKIVADIKGLKNKATPAIQSDKVRVTSKSKDTLQDIMTHLKAKDYGLPLQFDNYR